MAFHPLKLLLAAVLLAGPHPVAIAEIKCWINDQGVRECGNAVPPEYAQESYQEYSRRGVLMDETLPAPTEAEIIEREREAQRQREAEALRKEQARQDRILLQTFTSEADIMAARDEKLAAMEAQVRLAESRIGKLQSDLVRRIEKAAALERVGKTPDPSVQEDIAQLRRQIGRNEAYIAHIREEQARLREAYAADIERFRELKSGP